MRVVVSAAVLSIAFLRVTKYPANRTFIWSIGNFKGLNNKFYLDSVLGPHVSPGRALAERLIYHLVLLDCNFSMTVTALKDAFSFL